MSFTDINKWIVSETDTFLARQVVLERKDADCNLCQRSRTVSPSIWRSAAWALRIISLAFAMILLIIGCVSAQQFPGSPQFPGLSPSIAVNGASGGTTVTAGASMSVAVANGPGNANDWIGVCNAGAPVSSTQCDGAGYPWDYLNCTHTAPMIGVRSATCSLPAPSGAGNYYAIFFSNNSYTVLASAPFQVTVPSPSSASITLNGTSSGTTVSAGASISVAVANGPGNPADWIGVCNSGATPAPGQCDGAGYSWDYLNCTQTYPTTGSTSASCSLAAPSAGGNYIVGFFSNDTYTVLASAPFTVSGGGGGGSGSVAVTQSGTSHGIGLSAGGTQKCVWDITKSGLSAIGSGHTVVGYIHSANNADTTEMYPRAVYDNAGHTYTLSPGVHWAPYPEDIGIWYLTNIQGNPSAITFDYTQYPASGNTILDFCDIGLVEYSASGINAVVNPFNDNASSANPSLTISPTTSSLIWAFGATNSATDGSDLRTTGYHLLINNQPGDGMAVWGSNSTVSAGSITLTWNNPYWNATVCADGTHTTTGCSTVLAAVALSVP
jgi:hypothetical protein